MHGDGIDNLRKAIANSIDWAHLVSVDSFGIFSEVRKFVVQEQEANCHLLVSMSSLCSLFLAARPSLASLSLPRLFEDCIRLLANGGLVYLFSRSNQILLHPSFFYTYGSALIAAARRDGMGRLSSDAAYMGDFLLTDPGPVLDPAQQSVLLDAVIKELVNGELVSEVSTHGGSYFVFPTQPTQELADPPSREQQAAFGKFEGDCQGIYCSLVVRLLEVKECYPEGICLLRESTA
jgi:hypothetical protein